MRTAPPGPRQTRFEFDAPLRTPLAAETRAALSALLAGHLPSVPPPHPFFAAPGADLLLAQASERHLGHPGELAQGEDGRFWLRVSAAIGEEAPLSAFLDWIGPQLDLGAGELAGFVVPAGSHRHDMRLLAWSGEAVIMLGKVPDRHEIHLDPGARCSDAALRRAAGLPVPDGAPEIVRPAMRRVARGLSLSRPPLVNQKLLDGPYVDGPVRLRLWLAEAARAQLGYSTELVTLD